MSDTLTNLLLILLVIGSAFVLRRITGRLDRDRIREYLEKGGNKVLDIVWHPFGPGWWGSGERIYDVKYKTRHGQMRQGTCKTGMFGGVYWAGQAPPYELLESGGTGVTAETIDCLKCGAKISPRQSRCPQCGWSYAGQ